MSGQRNNCRGCKRREEKQDLKTGYLLGATPKKQQYGEIIGVVASALAIGATLFLLNEAWGFGSEELGAPQATLMKMIIEGIMGGNLPWGLILIGVFISVIVEILGIPVLPVAIGIYLPVQLNACIMVGGLIRLFFDKMKAGKRKDTVISNGILFCSGMIAGEGLVGILLAVFAVFGLGEVLDISGILNLPAWASNIGSILVFGLIILSLLAFTIWNKNAKKSADEQAKD
ncbi:MAG: OPT/YSL family transporter [Clostridia bacterium]|nr:OPT/YSL family transporter [Clostridia bacterium]